MTVGFDLQPYVIMLLERTLNVKCGICKQEFLSLNRSRQQIESTNKFKHTNEKIDLVLL